MKKKSYLVLAYHSLNDPIIKGLLLKYIQAYQKKSKSDFYLITFEQSNYKIPEHEKQKLKEDLKGKSIYWLPLNYQTGGRFILLKKIWNFSQALAQVLRIRVKYNVKMIIGFTTLSSIMAWVVSKLVFAKAVCFNVEPHSDYMVDFGIWRKNGWNYRILHFLERELMMKCKYLAVPTFKAYEELSDIRDSVSYVPTCIDLDDFSLVKPSKSDLRNKLKIKNPDKVIIYIGKFGGIYFSAEETAKHLKLIEEKTTHKVSFIIITPDHRASVSEKFYDAGINSFTILERIKFEQLSNYISVADAGILLLPEYSSQRFRSPIKTANYLACGVPIIVNKIVGDEAALVDSYNVGWVIDLAEPKIDFSEKPNSTDCINAVKKERGLHRVVEWMEEVLD